MNFTRTLVAALLVGSIIAGFAQGLSTQTASGIITSYSTITSTYYSPSVLFWTTTQYETKTTWTDRASQDGSTGPYVEVSGRWQLPAPRSIKADLVIKNLKGLSIKGGNIIMGIMYYRASDKMPLGAGIAVVSFSSIRPWESASVSATAEVIWVTGEIPSYVTDAEVKIEGVVITLAQATSVESLTAVTTLALSQTLTKTYVTTYTTPYTLSEMQSFLASGGTILLLVVVAGAAIVAVVVFTRRKAPAPAIREEMPAKLSTKMCVKCGYQLSADADYCLECGQKQT